MAARVSQRAALALFAAAAVGAEVELATVGTFAADDECNVDQGSEACALKLVQLRGAPAPAEDDLEEEVLESPEPPSEADYVVLSLPAGWEDFPDDPGNVTTVEAEMVPDDFAVDADDPSSEAGQMQPMGSGCQYHAGSRECYLYRACRGRDYCVMGGYMVVPGRPIAGMESINGGNAASLDYLMTVAKNHCGDTHCVLITNPVHHRTQDQLHIHYRHYNGGGSSLHHRLEASLCGTHGWQYFSECGAGKARIYSGFPGVFSAVASAYGGGSLAHVGITVWFTTACGKGKQTMILATTHCSIEHSISAR